jgi:hypothetical protein
VLASEKQTLFVFPGQGSQYPGSPWVGKSTFVEALGNHIIDEGHRVAALTVDPSSAISGGSILGDKTRMGLLSRRPEAYTRPSPSGNTLGGVTRRSHDALILCEAAGFDICFIHPKANEESPIAGEGLLIELVQAPPEVCEAFERLM